MSVACAERCRLRAERLCEPGAGGTPLARDVAGRAMAPRLVAFTGSPRRLHTSPDCDSRQIHSHMCPGFCRSSEATHLVCHFPNTPKYREVEGLQQVAMLRPVP